MIPGAGASGSGPAEVGDPSVDGKPVGLNDDGRPASPLRHPLPLLESLFSDHLDPGYQAAADRRAVTGKQRPPRPGQRSRLIYLAGGLTVVGLVLGIAAATTQDQAAGTNQARTGLRQDIDGAQRKQSALVVQESSLAAQIRSAQSSLGAGGPLQKVRQLEAQGGQTVVTGPGLTVVIDGSTANSGAGNILDSDIQLLVNGLWASGAEAIAIGGVRLSTTSSIRQAGSAILVDNRPVFFPLSIEAVGDPSSLHVKFVDTVGFGRFQTFVSLYGIRFDVSAQAALTLPAGGVPDLKFASAVPTATTTPSVTSSH